jgi:hypothetical protein
LCGIRHNIFHGIEMVIKLTQDGMFERDIPAHPAQSVAGHGGVMKGATLAPGWPSHAGTGLS